MSLRVHKAGPLTTVQDLGRPGHAHLGVPVSGAADRPALIRANRLVGNADGDAALEMTLLGGRFEFTVAARVAISGAAMPATLDATPVAPEQAFEVRPGQVLSLGAARRGVRGYLAVRGGIDVEQTLGSRATDLLSGLGPPALRDGDELPLRSCRSVAREPAAAAADIVDEAVLHFMSGPRADWFESAALQALTATPYAVSPHSNRIGVRLEGTRLARCVAGELDSEGLLPGAIQVPADGQPLVFLYDHPTTGGYPVIGVVDAIDLPRLAQARPGSRVRFVQV
ncbi:biotin-dependent carboxyltransferase family protein [Panacagrimonas sp.]|uniref:5-oxoprolinase subunit C family protein n=1 Tax=Panacagrimonas sp. TaxID=2480088 RepID=UPI003B526C38